MDRIALTAGENFENARRMMTRLLLARHGETTLSAEDRFAASTDVPLGPNGRAQAERLAARLGHDPIAAVYASPLQRTIDTATILAQPHHLPVVTRDGLREIAHGHWEGLRRSEVESMYPEEYAAWEEDPLTVAPAGGECGAHVIARAMPVIREIVIAHADQCVLVVSHKATIRLIIASLLGFDPRGYRDRLDQAPASLNIIDFKTPVRARLMLFNDVSHYAAKPSRSRRRLSKWWDDHST
jgi:probable phosphoglycerate mutase